MTRLDGAGIDWAGGVARRSAQEAQALAIRQENLARVPALMVGASAALTGPGERAPEDLGRVLGEAQRLVPEARQDLAAALARTLAPGSTGDAGTIVRSLVDKTFATGTEA